MNKYYPAIVATLIATIVTLLAWDSYRVAYLVTYGIVAIWSCLNFITFTYLFVKRCSSLALAISLTWFGTMLLLGWWWVYQILGRPLQMTENPVLFAGLTFHLVGAWLHFKAFQEFSSYSHWLKIAALVGAGMACLVLFLNPS